MSRLSTPAAPDGAPTRGRVQAATWAVTQTGRAAAPSVSGPGCPGSGGAGRSGLAPDGTPGTGSVIAKLVRPGWLVTPTLPPCAAVTASTIARPSPVLPVACDREESPRTNRSNRPGWRPAGM